MQGLLDKLFSVHSGEGKSMLLFAILGYLWALTVTSAVKFSDAQFIIHVGADSLPFVYICTAATMFCLAAVQIYAFQRVETHKIFIAVIISGMLFYSCTALCLLMNWGTEGKLLWYALRIFGYLLLPVVLTCFWTFIDQYHHIQNAKRRYSFFTSINFLGIITTGLIMRSGMISFQKMLFVIIALLGAVACWIYFIHRQLVPVNNEHEHEANSSQEELSLASLFSSIIKSPFTLLLMAIAFFTYLILSTTEFNYLSSFQQHFVPYSNGESNPELTQFLGKCVASISTVSLVIGLFVFPKIIRRFGVTSFLMFTPVFLFITFFGWSLSDALIFPIMGFFADEGAVYVVEDSNLNLMLNGVPSKMKYKIRIFIESFLEPLGMMMSGVLLSFSFVNSKLLGLILAMCACGVAFGLRRYYLTAIWQNLEDNAIHFDRHIQEWFNEVNKKNQSSTENRLLAILRSGDFESQKLALEALMHFHDRDMLIRLLKLLDQLPTETKQYFIEHLPQSEFASDPQVLDQLQRWSYEEFHDDLNGEVQLYLAKRDLLHPDKVFHNLEHPNLALKCAAIISLKKSWGHIPPPLASHYRTTASQETKKMLSSKKKPDICMALMVLGIDPTPHDVMVLLQHLKHPFVSIARAAATSIAEIVNPGYARHAPLIISKLASTNDHKLRMLCLQALEKIGDYIIVKEIIDASLHFRPSERRYAEQMIIQMGLKTVPTLLAIAKDTTYDDRCRVFAGRILGKISLPQLRSILFDIISVESERALYYFYHAHTIEENYPDLNLTMLKESLLSSYHAELDFIIQLLGVAGELEDCELLARLIRSDHPKLRSQVVEALEKTCDISIFRIIDPLVSELPLKEKLNIYLKKGYTPRKLDVLLDELAVSPMQLDQVIAATFMHRLKLPQWKESLRHQMSKNEEIFQNFALELLEA